MNVLSDAPTGANPEDWVTLKTKYGRSYRYSRDWGESIITFDVQGLLNGLTGFSHPGIVLWEDGLLPPEPEVASDWCSSLFPPLLLIQKQY